MKCKPLNQVRKRLLKWGFEHSESFRPDYHYPNENHIFKGNLKKVKDCPEFNHKDLKRPTDLEFFCNRCWDSIQLTQEPFDEIRPCMPKSGMRVVRIKRSYGFADENYRVVIPVKFQRVSRFKDGLAVAAIKKKYGFIDLKGEYVIPPQVDEALPFWEDMASARIGKKWGYIDTSGDFVIKPQFNFAYPFEVDIRRTGRGIPAVFCG